MLRLSSTVLLRYTAARKQYITAVSVNATNLSKLEQHQHRHQQQQYNRSSTIAHTHVLHISLRRLGSTGIIGSITTEHVSSRREGDKLQLVEELPRSLARKLADSNKTSQNNDEINEQGHGQENKWNTVNDNEHDKQQQNSKEQEQQVTVIDFTQPDKVALLQEHQTLEGDKSKQLATLYSHSFLTEQERFSLVHMIYKTHYESLANSEECTSKLRKVNKEMFWAEACMELKEITKWACEVERVQLEQEELLLEEQAETQKEETMEKVMLEASNRCCNSTNVKFNSDDETNKKDNKNCKDTDKEKSNRHQHAICKRIKRAVLERVELHKPLPYIIGNQPFYDCTIICKAPLLCPRPETEMWVYWYVQQHLKPVLRSQQIEQPYYNGNNNNNNKKTLWNKNRVVRFASLLRPSTWKRSANVNKVIKGNVNNNNNNNNNNDDHEVMSSELHAKVSNIQLLDMCCGTGCIGVAIAKHITNAHVMAVDIAPEAITITAQNAKLHHIAPERFKVVRSNLFDYFLEPPLPAQSKEEHSALHNNEKSNTEVCNKAVHDATDDKHITIVRRKVASKFAGFFDVLVCNPPYILPNEFDTLAPAVRLWESKIALVGDDDRAQRQYLYFKEIIEYGAQLLKSAQQRSEFMRDIPNLIVEVGLQAELVASIMERSGLYEEVEIHLDMAQQKRWISALSKEGLY